MNLYYNFSKKVGTNITCILKKIKLIIQSARHIKIYAQSTCHVMYHVSKYVQSYGGGVFSGFFFYEDGIQTEIFLGAKTENDLYYRSEKHY